MFYNVGPSLTSIVLFVLASLPPIKMNSIPSKRLDEYPNYLWAYGFHLTIFVIVNVLGILVIYTKNPQIRAFLQRELQGNV